MKKLKTLTAVVLLLCLTVSSVCAAAVKYPDTAGTKYEKAANILLDLGIMYGTEDGSFKPGDNITRAEIVTVIIRMLGFESLTIPNEEAVFSSPFEDVPESYWCAEDIIFAKNLGLVSGKTETTFDPDGYVTLSEASKLIVDALGYRIVAENLGGYPIGYMTQAAHLGIVKDISAAMDTPISRGDTALMIYRALGTEILEYNYTGSADGRYKVKEDSVLGEAYGKYKYQKGIVASNGLTSLTGEAEVADGEVLINGTVFKENGTGAGELLGKNVELFYTVEDGVNIIHSVCEGENKELTLNFDDNYVKYSSWCYEYYKNPSSDKKLTVYIDSGINVIYNGKAWSKGLTDSEMAPKSGEVRLIDADGDSKYETVIIKDVKNYVLTIADGDTLYALDNKKIELKDKDENENITVRDSNGTAMDFSELENEHVISALVSKDGELAELVVCLDVIYGKLERVKEKDGDTYVTVDGDEYVFADDCCIKQGSTVKIGETGSFTLDITGKVAYFSSTNRSFEKGYLLKSGLGKALDSTVSFKIFTEAGSFEILSAAEKVSVDKYRLDNDALVQMIESGGLKSEFIRFKRNSTGELYEIDTVSADNPQDGTSSSSLHKKMSDTTLHFHPTTRSFGAKAILGETGVIFDIPDDETEESRFAVLSPSSLERKWYKTDIYCTDSELFAEIVALHSDGKIAATASSAYMIKEIETIYDEYEGELWQYTAVSSSGIEEKLTLEKDADCLNDIDTPSKGDVLLVSKDNAGRIRDMEAIYTNSSGKGIKSSSSYDSSQTYVMGYAYSMTDSYMEFVSADMTAGNYEKVNAPVWGDVVSDDLYIYPTNDAPIWVYDAEKYDDAQVYKGTYRDIVDYETGGREDIVIMITAYTSPQSVFIIKK